jgi:hypothetical protein
MTDKRCDVCGARDAAADPLVAACDVLVLRALERIGNDLLSVERSRRGALVDRPRHEAHLRWQPDPERLDRALGGAWTHVPYLIAEHGCCGLTVDEVTATLDRYVRDLVQTMTGHSVVELRYRMAAYLGVPA